MSEELPIAMPVEKPEQRRFFRGWKAALIIAFIVLVISAGIFSWWLSRGKVSSLAARLDTLVYTVEPKFASKLQTVLVRPGQEVTAGQVLGEIETPRPAPAQPAKVQANTGIEAEIAQRVTDAQRMEREMTARLAEARIDEERLQKIQQESVTAHVRAQLAMRAFNPADPGYAAASQAEFAARAAMNSAREQYEQASRQRAAADAELKRLRYELSRQRRRMPVQSAQARARTAPQPVARQAPEPVDKNLYAPVSGKIVRVNGAPGQAIRTGQPIFFILPSGADMLADSWIQAWFPLEDKGKIKVGQKVNVRFSRGNLHFTGKVVEVGDEAQAPAANGDPAVAINAAAEPDRHRHQSERYLPVRITLEPHGTIPELQPGEKAECQIQTRYLLGSGLF